MTAPQGTLPRALGFLADALSPLTNDLSTAAKAQQLLRTLGVEAPIAPPSLLALAPTISALEQAVTAYANAAATDETSAQALEALATLVAASATAFQQIDALAPKLENDFAAYPDLLAAVDFAEVARRLADYLVIRNVRAHAPAVYNLVLALGVFQVEPVDDSGGLVPPYIEYAIRGDRLKKLASDPAAVAADVYGWAGGDFRPGPLLERLEYLLFALGFPADLYAPDDDDNSTIPGLTLVPAGRELRVPLYTDASEDAAIVFALGFVPTLPAAGTGFAVRPLVEATANPVFDLGRGLSLSLKADGDLSAPIALTIESASGIGLEIGGGALTSSIEANLTWQREDGSRPRLLYQPDWLTIDLAAIEAGVKVHEDGGTIDLGLEAGIVDGALAITPGPGDGFIQKVFPPDGVSSHFSFAVTWSPKAGIGFKGSGSLALTIPVHASIAGILDVDSLYVEIDVAAGPTFTLVLAASASLELGPFSAVVDKIGAQVPVTFPPGGGNLGKANADIQFKPPDGVGLSIDATVVTGGGYIEHHPGEYDGLLNLKLETIGITAIGLLNTVMPDGSKGFSLLLIIAAQFEDDPVQLGFGFSLTGVGGLAGVNRTMLVDVLRSGVRNGTVGSIMFPDDPVKNAPKIISDLRAVFPPLEGHYVFGPMLELAWGVPPLIIAELGVILELPPPLRLVILGRIKTVLPDEEVALVEIHMDSLGVLDFGQKTASVDATLYDSRVVQYALSGDMAFRLNWGDSPNFALAVGGFNPRFQPPPGFPSLRRLTLSMGTGDNPRFSLDCYFATTSNSVQFGAHVDAYAAEGGFAVRGQLGFDALFILSPFSMIAEMHASVDLLKGSSVLMSVHLHLTLTGPTPWHAHGSASVHLLFFDASVSVDKQWGDSSGQELPKARADTPLQQALKDPRNWTAALPAGAEQAVSFAGLPPAADHVLVHPLGQLVVSQKVVPLEVTISRFGSADVDGPNYFRISEVKLGGAPAASVAPAYDEFAMGQFLALSDDEKVSRPSFERKKSGVQFGSSDFSLGHEASLAVQYETFVVDGGGDSRRQPNLYRPGLAYLEAARRTGAGALSPVQTTGRAKYLEAGTTSPIEVEETLYLIADTDTLSPRIDLASAGGASDVYERLTDHLASHPQDEGRLQVVAAYEAA